MENENLLEPVVLEQLKSYSEAKLKLEKFRAIRKGSPLAATVIITSIAACCLLLGFLFGCVTLAFYLGSLFGSLLAGFGCLAALFIFFGLLLLAIQNGLQIPITNFIIKKSCN